MCDDKKLISTLYGLDLQSYKKIVDVYCDLDNRPDIENEGFNTSSWYVYLYLDNWISICSCFGWDVEFMVTDFETWEEFYYSDYQSALDKLEEF